MESPILAIDVIIEKDDKILLITRKNEPYEGKLAFPGGKVELNETIEEAALREVKEETGIKVKIEDMLGIYSSPKRDYRGIDKRGHIVSVVFVAKSNTIKTKPGSDASAAQWFDIDMLKEDYLAFDHYRILQDYLKWKGKPGSIVVK